MPRLATSQNQIANYLAPSFKRRSAALAALLLYLLCAGTLAWGQDATPGAPGFREGWRLALPGWEYQFPRDYFAHPEFKTEWWYFTGNLSSADGKKEYGFQMTFFRQGMIPPAEMPNGAASEWITGDVMFAHFAVTEITDQKFHFDHLTKRGVFGETGLGSVNSVPDASGAQPLIWVGDWKLNLLHNERYAFAAVMKDGTKLELTLAPRKAAVFHGHDGVSQKSEGEGRASHYFSFTRMQAEGSLQFAGESTVDVSGQAWFDQEWASNQLDREQVGWDWFSLQFDGGEELMLYQLRRTDGKPSPTSSGTFVDKAGKATHLELQDFTISPKEDVRWKSPATGVKYPQRWTIEVPKFELKGEVRSRHAAQELVLDPISYWEGSVVFSGILRGEKSVGRGYTELTGYSDNLNILRE